MEEVPTVQQMVEQALSNISRADQYIAWIDAGNQIRMIGHTAETSTLNWREQLKRHRKMDADYVRAIIDDERYNVRIERRLYPEFGNV